MTPGAKTHALGDSYVADPAQPVLVGSCAMSVNDDASDVGVKNGCAYAANGVNGLQIVDVSVATAPQAVAYIGFGGSRRTS